MSKVNINQLDIENLDELDEIEELNETFEKIYKGKKFDDGTTASRPAKKKGTKHISKELPEEKE